MYTTLYKNGYNGAWAWDILDNPTVVTGMEALENDAEVDFVFNTHPSVPNTCDCSDVAPSSDYTCA